MQVADQCKSSLNQSRQPLLSYLYNIIYSHYSCYYLSTEYNMNPEHSIADTVNTILKGQDLDYTYKQILQEPLLDRALGCMFGSIIGDALGSYVEFKSKPDQFTMKIVMEMPGGGTYDTKPGQGTDDTEMSLCLLHSLLYYDPLMPLSEQILGLELAIYHSYIGWCRTSPFDMGMATQTGIQLAASIMQTMFDDKNNQDPEKLQHIINECHLAVSCQNSSSTSNGYLMRIHPLAIFKAFLQKYKSAQSLKMTNLIHAEIKASHFSNVCLQSGTQFVDTIAALIARPNFGAIRQIYQRWAEKKSETEDWKKAVREQKWMEVKENQGWAKIAYTEAFNNLREISQNYYNDSELTQQVFIKIMERTIEKGGDTDTNAAIVGAMMGAIFGFSKLPAKYLTKILQLRMRMEEFLKIGKKATSRPPFFEPRNGLINIIKLHNKFSK